MIYVNEKDLVLPGDILAEEDFYSGRGTFQEKGKIYSKLLGLVSLRNKKINVIPLKSKYYPKKGDMILGKVTNIRFSMLDIDINSPYSGFLSSSEVFGREKKDLTRAFRIGDTLSLRVLDVDEIKKAKLGVKNRRFAKLRGGIIVEIPPTKVPRLIGKKGSMINTIKEKTNCKIVVGQNGLVWIKGEERMQQITKDIIKEIESKSNSPGLTDYIRNKLSLIIDGKLPEDRPDNNFYQNDVLEKPKLQNFKEELELEEFAEEYKKELDKENSDTSFNNDEYGESFDEKLERLSKSQDLEIDLGNANNNSSILKPRNNKSNWKKM